MRTLRDKKASLMSLREERLSLIKASVHDSLCISLIMISSKEYAAEIVGYWTRLGVTDDQKREAHIYFSFREVILKSSQFFRMSSSGLSDRVVCECRLEMERKRREWEQKIGEKIREKQQLVLGMMHESRFSEEEMREVESLWSDAATDAAMERLETDEIDGREREENERKRDKKRVK